MACPMPIVKINNIMRSLEPGATLQVKADDPAFKLDIEACFSKTGHQLLSFQGRENFFITTIEK